MHRCSEHENLNIKVGGWIPTLSAICMVHTLLIGFVPGTRSKYGIPELQSEALCS